MLNEDEWELGASHRSFPAGKSERSGKKAQKKKKGQQSSRFKAK